MFDFGVKCTFKWLPYKFYGRINLSCRHYCFLKMYFGAVSLSLYQAEGTQETVSHNALLCPAGNLLTSISHTLS